jgi:hypothetical protein
MRANSRNPATVLDGGGRQNSRRTSVAWDAGLCTKTRDCDELGFGSDIGWARIEKRGIGTRGIAYDGKPYIKNLVHPADDCGWLFAICMEKDPPRPKLSPTDEPARQL